MVPAHLRWKRSLCALSVLCAVLGGSSRLLGFAGCRPQKSERLQDLQVHASSEDVWKAAYDAEMERNELLREQLRSLDIGESSDLPEACEVDWKDSYEKLAACNQELEETLRSGGGLQAGGRSAQVQQQTAAMKPLVFEVPLPEQGNERLELVRYFTDGREVAFYMIRARLPLGLQLTKCNSGPLKGAFLVEDVVEGGQAWQGGVVLAGDILHAVTVVMDRANLGIKTEDFVSNVVGGLGRWRQTILDTSFINTVEDLVAQMQSNKAMGTDTELTLVFERDLSESPRPPEVLDPVEAE
ncbi:unnamed protein product [Symbiodinium microadriaticum]|nr:unnamed protein product [Symbiodinium sp. KB8]CAE7274667.1 unnamed protein product [Symbiodinium microadriaticum]